MTRAERKAKIERIAERIWKNFEDVVSDMHYLEELGCKAEAKKLDTVCSKLYNMHYSLLDKCKEGGK